MVLRLGYFKTGYIKLSEDNTKTSDAILNSAENIRSANTLSLNNERDTHKQNVFVSRCCAAWRAVKRLPFSVKVLGLLLGTLLCIIFWTRIGAWGHDLNSASTIDSSSVLENGILPTNVHIEDASVGTASFSSKHLPDEASLDLGSDDLNSKHFKQTLSRKTRATPGENDNAILYNNAEAMDKTMSSIAFLSKKTLQNEEGYALLDRDNIMCGQSGRTEYVASTCLGPPYLYLTFHGGFNSETRVKNVCKYTRDGCSLGAVLLPNSVHTFHSLRGMVHGHDGSLLVAEAWRKKSKILRFSQCNPALNNTRELFDIVVDGDSKAGSGMLHPYGVAIDKSNNLLYVSSQGTNAVLRYNLETGEPAPLSSSELAKQQKSVLAVNGGRTVTDKKEKSNSSFKQKKFHKGTFVALGNDRVRGTAVDVLGRVYVADKDRGLMVFQSNGTFLTLLPVASPISVYYDKPRQSVWVGSSELHFLYEYNVTTWEIIQTIQSNVLAHPAGLVGFNDSLFVVSQDNGKLLKFSMLTGKLDSEILPKLIDAGEQILLSDC